MSSPNAIISQETSQPNSNKNIRRKEDKKILLQDTKWNKNQSLPYCPWIQALSLSHLIPKTDSLCAGRWGDECFAIAL
jgi:hypothetical protein